MICVLFFSYFLNNNKKPSKMPHTYFLMLDANNDNSWATTKSPSIKSYKLNEILEFFIKLIMIVTFKTS